MLEVATASGSELFATYDVPVRTDRTTNGVDPQPSVAFLALTGFCSEDVRGTLVLACAEGPLRASNPTGSTSPRDWIGELANQLLGRVKNDLLCRNIELVTIPPTVVSGQHVHPVLSSSPGFHPVLMKSADGGLVCLWIEAEVSPRFQLKDPASNPDIPEPGEVMLF